MGELANRSGLPTIENVRWRVDVILRTDAVSKVLRPSILLRLTLSNGDIRTMEVSVEQFHMLRHRVAEMMHEMQIAALKVDHVNEIAARSRPKAAQKK